MVLSSLIHKLDGPYPEADNYQEIAKSYSIHRTVFGNFRRFLFGGERRWTKPDSNAIEKAAIISIDPFFARKDASDIDAPPFAVCRCGICYGSTPQTNFPL